MMTQSIAQKISLTQRSRPAAQQSQTHLTPAALQAMLAKTVLENQVQADICAYLRTVRLPFSITNAEATYNIAGELVKRVETGWQDLTACESGALNAVFAGKMLAIEVKRAVGGTLSYDQALNLQRIHQANGLICIARSVDDVITVRTTGTRLCDLEEIAAAMRKGQPKRKFKPRRKIL